MMERNTYEDEARPFSSLIVGDKFFWADLGTCKMWYRCEKVSETHFKTLYIGSTHKANPLALVFICR